MNGTTIESDLRQFEANNHLPAVPFSIQHFGGTGTPSTGTDADVEWALDSQASSGMDNAWGDIFAITDLANGDYVAVTGRSLSDDHLFAVVRRDAAPRYLAALREFFGDVRLVDLDTARTMWSDADPNDASQAPPP